MLSNGLKTVTITCRPTKKHNGTTILLTTRLTRFYDGQLDMDPKMSRSILGKFIFKSPTQNNDRTTMEESESTFLHYQDWSNAPLRSISIPSGWRWIAEVGALKRRHVQVACQGFSVSSKSLGNTWELGHTTAMTTWECEIKTLESAKKLTIGRFRESLNRVSTVGTRW